MSIRRAWMGAACVLMAAGMAEPARAISAANVMSEAAQEPSVRLIDARDLVSVIPAPPTRTPTMMVTDLVMGLGRSLQLKAEPLADGVFTVIGEDNSQAEFIQLLEQVRNLYRGQYELELACYGVPVASPPEIGAAAGVDGAPIRVRTAVTRRVETKVEASRTVTAIIKWSPVVADNSVGYDAQTENLVVGLMASVLVGAGPDGDAPFSIDVRIRGEVSDVQLKELMVPLQGDAKGGLPVQLPSLSKRTINADTRVGTQPRVVGVVPGLKDGELLVIAASVKPVKR